MPQFYVDVGVGPYKDLNAARLDYVTNELHDGIEFLEKSTGRKFNDELFIEAVKNEVRSTSLWAAICAENKAQPAPLDEKTMYSLYVLATLSKSSKWCADFYQECLDEVKDRVARGFAAVPNERCRVMSDTQPPWAFLKIFRYLEEFGAVSIGSLYTFGLEGTWETRQDGSWMPRTLPWKKGIEINDRDTDLARRCGTALRLNRYPSAAATLRTDLRRGFPSLLSALYRLSRPRPVFAWTRKQVQRRHGSVDRPPSSADECRVAPIVLLGGLILEHARERVQP